MRPAATPARPEGGEKDGPAAAVLAGRAGFRRPALAAARQGGKGKGPAAAGGWGVRPSRPTRGRAALVFPVEVVSTMEFDFFF